MVSRQRTQAALLPHGPHHIPEHWAMRRSLLLALPAELRNHIVELVLLEDLHHFPEPVCRPPLADVCRQLKREYSDIFYGSDLIKLDAYYSDTDSWAEIQGRAAK
ncbi:hypothetical protein LTR53_004174 [Teratosphaeriaceae sp. CCFEE 6253]|nr:hypothetical protein LTR53_004174 [Teratosphaeriaceae sp. CCFEE 6253]